MYRRALARLAPPLVDTRTLVVKWPFAFQPLKSAIRNRVSVERIELASLESGKGGLPYLRPGELALEDEGELIEPLTSPAKFRKGPSFACKWTGTARVRLNAIGV